MVRNQLLPLLPCDVTLVHGVAEEHREGREVPLHGLVPNRGAPFASASAMISAREGGGGPWGDLP